MGFLLFLHIASCILLVITILMQAGRGGGLAESFSSAESMFGTQTNKFMVRTSSVLAVIFLGTSLVLAVAGSKGSQSIMADKKLLPPVKQEVPAAEPEVTVNVSDPKPMDESTAPVVNAAK